MAGQTRLCRCLAGNLIAVALVSDRNVQEFKYSFSLDYKNAVAVCFGRQAPSQLFLKLRLVLVRTAFAEPGFQDFNVCSRLLSSSD